MITETPRMMVAYGKAGIVITPYCGAGRGGTVCIASARLTATITSRISGTTASGFVAPGNNIWGMRVKKSRGWLLGVAEVGEVAVVTRSEKLPATSFAR